MHKKVFSQITVIVVLSVLIGILYNNSSMNPLPLIAERTEDFSQSDSLMIAMMKQDSILKAADSLKLLSLRSEDSLRLLNEQRIKDSLERASKLDSLKHVADSLKAARLKREDSLKSVTQKRDSSNVNTAKPVDVKLDFAKLMYDKRNTFVDARDEKDYNEGHIQGAVNIPYHNLEQYKSRFNQFSKNQVLVLYCSAGCDVSVDLAYAMVKEGFTKLYVFRGGWDEWKNAGYPIN